MPRIVAPTYQQFWNEVCRRLGVAPTVGNSRAFGVIVIIEGRNTYWNPFNWTLPATYPAYNTTGVREYPDWKTGAAETANNFLTNSRWAPFVQSLNGAQTRLPPLRAIAAIYAQWGSYPPFMDIDWQRGRDVLLEQMPTP